MESIHGIDVSWLHSTHNKEGPRARASSNTANGTSPKAEVKTADAITSIPEDESVTTHASATNDASNGSAPRPIPTRPGFTRSQSSEKAGMLRGAAQNAPGSPTTSRRNSWLSSISSKFGGTSPGSQPNASPTSPAAPPAEQRDPRAPVGTPPRGSGSTILPAAQQPVGAAPYTPAPPKSGQNGFLQSALRRLSSNSSAQVDKGFLNKAQHGLCERKVLNVDHQRERCKCPELQLSKLRRVAFCVDVEIASVPKYYDDEPEETKKAEEPKPAVKEKKAKKKLAEKGEGEALKRPQEVKEDKENDGVLKATGEVLSKEPKLEATQLKNVTTVDSKPVPQPKAEGDTGEKDTKKKEKKKRSEEERKARKEKKRKQAEANGTVPVELVRHDSDSSIDAAIPPGANTPKTQASPTTDPARIYRRCCQLRETPILKKITEQLSSPLNCDKSGVVAKLDLSGYWMQLPDLVTLGDYLAVVPVKELTMEGCGLTDEGIRVILAGLLAAKLPQHTYKKRYRSEKSEDPAKHNGVVERICFKNNSNIGREGWRHLCLFINMSRSIKVIDMSMNKFPQPAVRATSAGPGTLQRTPTNTSPQTDIAQVLANALECRLAGGDLELLNIAETGITTSQLGTIIEGVIKCGTSRLGLAGNAITAEGVVHVARYMKEGRCEGLDVGGNDLRDHLSILAEALDPEHPLWALSLSNCDLTPDALSQIFPTLAKLKNFRFIDLSHNPELFSSRPSAVNLIRKYLPTMPMLKRIHLTDVALTSEQAIALAEILPESPGLAHVNILGNSSLSALASATDEENQEEACALYASLMAAVRVSKTLVCIDIDVPSPESSEVVKALAKQVVAYCLRNMERGPVAEIAKAAAAISGSHGGEKEVVVPDVLLHLVGHEDSSENPDDDDPAPDQDYVIGGTGVVKALGICLRNSGYDSRRPSTDRTRSGYASDSGTASPKKSNKDGGKAKDMSKNLLGSARKIRARLQPAMLKDAQRSTGDAAYQRLQFLDQTLERMIKRFEDEYPETRLPPSPTDSASAIASEQPSISPTERAEAPFSDVEGDAGAGAVSGDDDVPSPSELRPNLSRHNSDVSLASKALTSEEGRMHRFGQAFRRDLIKPEGKDYLHGTTGNEVWAPHLQMLRATIEELGGEEIRRKVQEGGQEAVLKALGDEAGELRKQIIQSDPVGWAKFVEAQEAAERNRVISGPNPDLSAVE